MKVVTVAQMRAIERETDAAGVSYAQMMENAGRGVARAILDRVQVEGRSVVVLVGPGNNGGDGLVAGRYLAQAGARVSFYLSRPRPAHDTNYAQVQEMALPVAVASADRAGERLQDALSEADVVVDALLGTGVERPVKGSLKKLLLRSGQALKDNRDRRLGASDGAVSPTTPSHRPAGIPLVVAVDCPSGLNCDTGALDPAALPADLTVTFAAPKVGQFRFPGAAAIGELLVVDIGSDQSLPAVQSVELELTTADQVRRWLPRRPPDAHKGTFGRVMIAAGSVNYVGAAALAGAGAYRAGAGLVTLAVPGSIHAPLAAQLAEATYVLLPHDMGAMNEDAAKVLLEALGDLAYDALLIGPGLGRDVKTGLFLWSLLAGRKAAARTRIGFVQGAPGAGKRDAPDLPPLVVDADGLNLLAETDGWADHLPPNCVLTPHPGEMARLLKCQREEVTSERLGVAQRAAASWGQIVALKGAFTVVAAPDGRTTLIPFANPALATAGSGDVQAGAIAGMLAQGLEPYQAAVAGAFLHGAAGQKAAQEIGRAGVAAGDLPLFLAAALAEMET
jgi:NAD(P)H-hydrate epimerase